MINASNLMRTERKRPLAESICQPKFAVRWGFSLRLGFVMAPRAYWKGYLKLSLVSCPIALFPATSEREKISFHQINKSTGHRIKYRKVDAETGEEVDAGDIIKGYEVAKGEYIELEPEELEAIAIESKRVIDIDEFEHAIALKPRGKGLLGITLRYPYEVRNEANYFDDIPSEKIPKDML